MKSNTRKKKKYFHFEYENYEEKYHWKHTDRETARKGRKRIMKRRFIVKLWWKKNNNFIIKKSNNNIIEKMKFKKRRIRNQLVFTTNCLGGIQWKTKGK